MALQPPGTGVEPVKTERVATIASGNQVDRWLEEQNTKAPTCACGCGRQIVVKRSHYWKGIPKLHGRCRHKGMQAKRDAMAGDEYINGTPLAKQLGIGRNTLGR